MTYHLYIADKNYSSWSLRPWLLMRVHSIPFEEHLMPFQPGHGGRQPHWKVFSPTCQVPCLHHFPPSSSASSSPTSSPTALTPQDPVVVWESLAIVDYLADLHPDLPIWPGAPVSDTDGLTRRAWARSAAAEMHAGFAHLRDEMTLNVGLRVDLSSSPLSPAAATQLRRLDDLWSEGLARFGGPYLAGPDFGAVDAFFAPFALRLQTFVGSADALSEASRAYAARLLELPAMREWVDAALKENWREASHEEDTVRGRRIIKDLRRG